MSRKSTVLVVDDNRSAADALCLVLRRHAYAAEALYDGQAALERLDAGGVDVVLTDLRMEPVDGLELLRHARGLALPPEVLVFTGYGTVEAAVEAMRLGARDFMTKPVSPQTVIERLEQLAGSGPRVRVQDGVSSAARALSAHMDAVSQAGAPVLIRGEPGSGRDQVARHLHVARSAGRPLAVLAHPGRAELAELGRVATVLLPNVDLLETAEQAQLVRVVNALDEVGGPRLLATAGLDWRAPGGGPGQELFYRLAVLELRVPPLRERPDDIPSLLSAWLTERVGEDRARVLAPSAEQLKALRLHAWPGNLRELAAVAERVAVFGADSYNIHSRPHPQPAQALPELVEGFNLTEYLEDIERTILVRALDQAGEDRVRMSKMLGVERNTLRYKLNKYNLLPRG